MGTRLLAKSTFHRVRTPLKNIPSLIIFLVLCVFFGCDIQPLASTPVNAQAERRDDAQKIYSAYQNQQSGIFVESNGKVVRILPDDLKGSRHQRFILELSGGQTILIAHNIDLAPRVENLNLGDEVYFCGDYEWKEKGGAVHWTHHDPGRRRIGGWLEHKGLRYQ